MSAVLFVWWLFGFLSYFPGIDGLSSGTTTRILVVCFLLSSGLWLSTFKFGRRFYWIKLLCLVPSVIVFPVVCYLISPPSLFIPAFAFIFAIDNLNLDRVRAL